MVMTVLVAPLSALAEEAADSEGGETDASPPEFVERARALFRMGVELADQGHPEEAAQRFEQALGLHDAPAIRYNLASVYAVLGRRSEAAAQAQAIISSDDATSELRSQAETLLSELESHLGRLSISLDGAGDDVQLSLDDRALTADQAAQPLWVEPGRHVITAARGDAQIARSDVEVAAGSTEQVDLAVTAQVEEPMAAPVVEPVAGPVVERRVRRSARQRQPLSRDGRIWLGVGVGAALVIVAIVVGVSVGTRDPEVEPPVAGNFGPGVLEWP